MKEEYKIRQVHKEKLIELSVAKCLCCTELDHYMELELGTDRLGDLESQTYY